MKTYIGIEEIKAEPMTRGAYNIYRGWQIPTDEDPADKGYIIKHKSGHKQWLPKEIFESIFTEKGANSLNDTALLMKSADFKERFRAEYEQLLIRLRGLMKMLDSYKAGTLPFKPKCSYELLYEQFVNMKHYLNVLDLRATVEGIELSESEKSNESNCC